MHSIPFLQLATKFTEAKHTHVTKNGCVPLDAFGAIDSEMLLPQKLIELVPSFVAELSDTKWTKKILVEIKLNVYSTNVKDILQAGIEQLNIQQVVAVFLAVFRMDVRCYDQPTIAYRFGHTEQLITPSKFVNILLF